MDKFETMVSGLDSPAKGAYSITPNDSADLAVASRAIYIGGSGDVKATTVGGDTVTFTSLAAGTILPVRIARVFSTDTTATNLVGLV